MASSNYSYLIIIIYLHTGIKYSYQIQIISYSLDSNRYYIPESKGFHTPKNSRTGASPLNFV